jgi:hypothetical protein
MVSGQVHAHARLPLLARVESAAGDQVVDRLGPVALGLRGQGIALLGVVALARQQ